jgi:hypothetical protein
MYSKKKVAGVSNSEDSLSSDVFDPLIVNANNTDENVTVG